MNATAKPMCVPCGVDRKLTVRVPVTDEYVITSYECPNCTTVLRLVEFCDSIEDGPAARY
ncbi:hypothetical protein V1278_001935 [Bradyrhizobium sp. AZCC 1577]